MPDEDDPEYDEHLYDDYYVQPVNGVWPDEEVSKGGPGSGRKPEGGSASLFTPRNNVTVESASPLFADPTRQDPFWFSDAKGDVATLSDAAGNNYRVFYADWDATMETSDGAKFSTIEEANALGIHNDADLASRVTNYIDGSPHLAISSDSYDMDEELDDWNDESWETNASHSDATEFINSATEFISGQPENRVATPSPSISSQMGQAAPAFNGDKMTVPTTVNARELLDGVCSNMSYWGSWFGEIKISNGKDTGTVGYESQENVLGEDGKPSPTDDWSKVTFTAKCDDPEADDDGDHSAVKTANMSDIARAYSQYNEKYSHLGSLDDTDAIGTDAFWQLVFYGDVVYG
jgi:hypothetical protein